MGGEFNERSLGVRCCDGDDGGGLGQWELTAHDCCCDNREFGECAADTGDCCGPGWCELAMPGREPLHRGTVPGAVQTTAFDLGEHGSEFCFGGSDCRGNAA